VEWLLDRIEHLCRRFRQVAREITQEGLLGKPFFIAIEHDAGRGLRRRAPRNPRRHLARAAT
jgi:hypothetical protein